MRQNGMHCEFTEMKVIKNEYLIFFLTCFNMDISAIAHGHICYGS